VEPGSRAASVGVQPGDLLLRINGQEVRTPEEVSRRLGQILRGEAGFIGLVVDVEDEAGEPQVRSGC
jgi:type II secretory pathway component PulC